MEISLDSNYKELLKEIKEKIRNSQIRASLAVNSELIQLYWHIGSRIIEKQKESQWGDQVLETLAHDLYNEFPKMRGFSTTNLKRMKQFYLTYHGVEIGAQLVPQLIFQIPWGHIITLIQQIKKRKREGVVCCKNFRTWLVQSCPCHAN
jgi:predicted nuclease of restriction endonuclease-like (RecB) superfamily